MSGKRIMEEIKNSAETTGKVAREKLQKLSLAHNEAHKRAEERAHKAGYVRCGYD